MFGLKAGLDPVLSSWREALRFVTILKRFEDYLRPQIWPMLFATLASVAYTAVTLLEPWPLQLVFDGVLLEKPVHFLGPEHVDTPRMVQRRGELSFPQEALARFRGRGPYLGEYLQSDPTPAPLILRLPYLSVPPLAEETDQAKGAHAASINRGFQMFFVVMVRCHRSLPREEGVADLVQ